MFNSILQLISNLLGIFIDYLSYSMLANHFILITMMINMILLLIYKALVFYMQPLCYNKLYNDLDSILYIYSNS